MPVWYEIKTLDGRVLSRTHSVGVSDAKWRWIKDNVRANAECDDADIDVEETDNDGDFITVKGERYARVQISEDFSDTEEHALAMEEREIFKANASAQVELARLRAKVAYLEHEVDTWKDRYEAADEALTQTIRDFDKMLNDGVK